MNRPVAPALGAVILLLNACTPAMPPATTAPAAARSDSAAFEQYLDDYLSARRDRGATDPDAWLQAWDEGAARRDAERAAERLVELRRIDTAGLSTDQRIDWLLVQSWLERTVYDTVLQTARRVPGRYLTLGDLYWRVAGERPPSPAEWVSVRRDLERAPRVLALGRRQLMAPPPLWIRLAVGTAASYSRFLREEFLARVTERAPDSLRAGLRDAGDAARAALDAYAAFLRDTLVAGAESSWQAGEAYYDRVLGDANFLPYTAASMIAEGRRIHAATKLALDSLAAQLRPGTAWRVLADEMRTRHPDAGAITAAYEAASRRVKALLIRDALVTLPPCEDLTFVPTPPQLRETYAWGGYGGIQDREGVAVGRFFVTDVVPGMSSAEVNEKLRTQNNGWIAVIALHEGYPGHHLQSVYQRRAERSIRRRGGNTYYQEGWALYAEHWMARAGLFDTPDARLAQLQMRLWRTARVIIDPSLHTGRMSYEEAVQFFVDDVGLERSAAEAEVNRFTTWPTQAPSYIIGWLEIERLKRDIMTAEGARFSERRFVERILESGGLPPALMRRAVLHAYGLGN